MIEIWKGTFLSMFTDLDDAVIWCYKRITAHCIRYIISIYWHLPSLPLLEVYSIDLAAPHWTLHQKIHLFQTLCSVYYCYFDHSYCLYHCCCFPDDADGVMMMMSQLNQLLPFASLFQLFPHVWDTCSIQKRKGLTALALLLFDVVETVQFIMLMLIFWSKQDKLLLLFHNIVAT